MTVDHSSPVPMTICDMLRVPSGVEGVCLSLNKPGFTVTTTTTFEDKTRIIKTTTTKIPENWFYPVVN